MGSFAERLAATFDDGPLDGTQLSATISETVPGLHASVRAQEFHDDLRRRIAAAHELAGTA